jgi:hypothetical protein
MMATDKCAKRPNCRTTAFKGFFTPNPVALDVDVIVVVAT